MSLRIDPRFANPTPLPSVAEIFRQVAEGFERAFANFHPAIPTIKNVKKEN